MSLAIASNCLRSDEHERSHGASGRDRAAAAERSGPSVVGLGRGWGRGSGVVVARRPGAHQRPQPARARRSRVHLRRRPPRDRPRWPASTSTSTSPCSRSTPATSRRSSWAAGATPLGIGTPVVALANPGGRGLRATLGFVSADGRSFRGPRGRRIARRDRAHRAAPARLLGRPARRRRRQPARPQRVRLRGRPDPRRARRRAAARARRGARRAARRRRRTRLGVAVAPPRVARRLRRAVGLPERDGLLVRGGRGRQPRRPRRHRARRPDRRRGRQPSSTASTRSTRRSTRSRRGGDARADRGARHRRARA